MDHSWNKIGPESLLIFLITMYAALLLWYFYDQRRKPVVYIVLFSLTAGFGLATKFTFLPLLVIPLFLLQGLKHKIYYILGTLAAFFLFTSPSFREYPIMFAWLINLLTHKGMYGHGDTGLIDLPVYLQNIGQIIGVNLFFSVILILAVVVFLLRFFRGSGKRYDIKQRILLSLITANIFGILLVAKHYFKNYYLIPELALSGITLFFTVESLHSFTKYKRTNTLLYISFLILALFVFIMNKVPQLQSINNGYRNTNEEYREANQFMDTEYPGYFRIYYYPDGFNKFSALKFGNGYSNLHNQQALDSIYPDVVFFNRMNDRFMQWEFPVPVEKIIHKYGTRILITGRQIDQPHLRILDSLGIRIKPVFIRFYQAVYEVESLSERLQAIADQNKKIITCGAETVTSDGRQFQAGDYNLSDAYLRTGAIKRSGLYSIQMKGSVKYAFNLNIDSLFPGQEIDCRIWRYPQNTDAGMVVAAEDVKDFYALAIEPDSTDDMGWQRLRLHFEVPDIKPPVKSLKFYLWNRKEENVYFDDLKVILK